MQDKSHAVRRQLQSLCAMALLSPVLRLIPGSAAERGGRAAWAGPLAALPLLLLYVWALCRLRSRMREGESLPELSLRALGKGPGRALLLLYGAWLLLYAGFTLRAGADRFAVTIFPRSGAAVFVIPMGLLALLTALGPFRSLLRLARMVEPLLLGVLFVILLAAFRAADPTELLPLIPADAGALVRSAWPALDLVSVALAAFFFFLPAGGPEEGLFPRAGRWAAALSLLLTALGAAIQGRFGPALCARLATPFFALVRNLVFFRSLERMEALVVGLWIFPDFLLTGLCLHAAQRCLRLGCGYTPREGERRLSMAQGRWLIWLGGTGATALGLFLARDPAGLLLWSRGLIPALSLSGALLLPGLCALGIARKKL